MRFILSIFPLFVVITISAQEKEIELDPITVTASLTPLNSSKTGRNLLIVKGDQLARLPVNSIDELIRYLPGLEVQSRGPMGVQSNITIRGGTFQQVLVILDGIRLNDPLSGHFNSYIPISPAEIDRIEILKGASSAIYGTEAVGGVVNIITKSFSALKGKQQQRLNAQVSTGEFGLRNAQAGFYWQKNKTSVGGGILQNVADGQQLRGSKGFFNLTTVSLSAKQFLSEAASVSYRFAYDDRNFSAQNFYSQLLSDTATENVVTRWHQLNYSVQKKKHKFTFDAGWKEASDKFQIRKSSIANTNYSKILQALAIHTYQINDKSSLTSGWQLINRSVKSNNRGNHQVLSTGAFVLLNQRVGEHFNINPSLRFDWNEKAGFELVPQLNLSYRHKDLLLRGSAGRSTRDADFTERFNNYQPALVGAGNRIGNPDLNAETSFSYEAGADYFVSTNFKISAGWFRRFHNGLIDYVLTPYAQMPRQVNLVQGGNYSLAKNIAKVNTRGAEFDVQYNHLFDVNHRIILSMGAIIMKSTSSDTVPSLYVSNHAKFLYNFSMQYRYKFFNIAVNGLYKERRPQTGNAAFVPISKNYFLMNVKAEGLFLQDKLGVFVQADNIFNKRYADILGTVMPNRWMMAGLRVSL